MRPHRIINCTLWLVIGGISLHILIFVIISLASESNEKEYISYSRSVKELQFEDNFQAENLLTKLHQQVVQDDIKFTPNPYSGPLVLERYHNKSFNLTEFTLMFNASLYGKHLNSLNSSELLRIIHKINRNQDIINSNLLKHVEFVIVIQVHNRLEYLTILIDSLLNVKDIHKALIIFSHDFYSSEINYLIRSIRFAPTLQIFFPFSQQIFVNEFPGRSAKDCDFKLKKRSSGTENCFNTNWSDTYGNYRNHRFTQTKHHWAWKANFIFERIRVLQDSIRPVVFIEEDHYLTEDFIYLLRLMWLEKKKYPKVSIVSLGTYEKRYNFNPSSKIQHGDWISSYHNMGMTFDRTVWNKIKGCVKSFCEFDDYNWDWSLHYLNKQCLNDGLGVLLLKYAPRIYHIGECGIHHKKKECNPYIILYKIRKMLTQNLQFLYPESLTSAGATNIRSKKMKPNGGWSDKRDQKLCTQLVMNSSLLDIITSVTYPYQYNSNNNSKPLILLGNTKPSNFELSVVESAIL